MASSDVWDADTARRYDDDASPMFAPEVLEPAVERLAQLAGGGPALEFAIGTGRVAIPLIDRGITVSGIELSQPMVDELHKKRPDVHVVVGDMASCTVEGEFSLVYLVWNSIANLCTQAEQVRCFRNAASHLTPGGRFVVELWVPPIHRVALGQIAVPFHVGEHHAGFDTYDLTTQRGTSHHYAHRDGGRVTYSTSNFRYIWPSECDLMAELAGLNLEQRSSDWAGSLFTQNSETHVSIWRKPPLVHTSGRGAAAHQ